MDQATWHEEFARVEQRIERNLQKLREHYQQMAEVMRDAEQRRRSWRGGSSQ
jgi:hypothetical protein